MPRVFKTLSNGKVIEKFSGSRNRTLAAIHNGEYHASTFEHTGSTGDGGEVYESRNAGEAMPHVVTENSVAISGDGTTSTYSIPTAPTGVDIYVEISGVTIDDYTIAVNSGTTEITFSPALGNGVVADIFYVDKSQQDVTILTTGDGTTTNYDLPVPVGDSPVIAQVGDGSSFTDYTISEGTGTNGADEIIFSTPPANNEEIAILYTDPTSVTYMAVEMDHIGNGAVNTWNLPKGINVTDVVVTVDSTPVAFTISYGTAIDGTDEVVLGATPTNGSTIAISYKVPKEDVDYKYWPSTSLNEFQLPNLTGYSGIKSIHVDGVQVYADKYRVQMISPLNGPGDILYLHSSVATSNSSVRIVCKPRYDIAKGSSWESNVFGNKYQYNTWFFNDDLRSASSAWYNPYIQPISNTGLIEAAGKAVRLKLYTDEVYSGSGANNRLLIWGETTEGNTTNTVYFEPDGSADSIFTSRENSYLVDVNFNGVGDPANGDIPRRIYFEYEGNPSGSFFVQVGDKWIVDSVVQAPVANGVSIWNQADWAEWNGGVWDTADDLTLGQVALGDFQGADYSSGDGYIPNGDKGIYEIDIITAATGGASDVMEIYIYTYEDEETYVAILEPDGSGEDMGGGLFKYTLTIDMSSMDVGYEGEVQGIATGPINSVYAYTIDDIRLIEHIPVPFVLNSVQISHMGGDEDLEIGPYTPATDTNIALDDRPYSIYMTNDVPFQVHKIEFKKDGGTWDNYTNSGAFSLHGNPGIQNAQYHGPGVGWSSTTPSLPEDPKYLNLGVSTSLANDIGIRTVDWTNLYIRITCSELL